MKLVQKGNIEWFSEIEISEKEAESMKDNLEGIAYKKIMDDLEVHIVKQLGLDREGIKYKIDLSAKLVKTE